MNPVFNLSMLWSWAMFFVLVPDNLLAESLSGISEAELDERYAFIQSRLNDEGQQAFWWQHGWEGFYGVSALVQAGQAIASDNSDDELRFGVGAFKSSVALASMYFNPIPATDGAESLDGLPGNERQEKIARLKQAELLLKERAVRSESIHTFERHGSAILFNLITAGVVAIYGEQKDAIASALGGIIASEVNIWTQPSNGEQDWLDYQKGNFHRSNEISWTLIPRLDGLALSVSF